MKKWQHIHFTRHGSLQYPEGKFEIFPANLIDTDWLFVQFPKAKKNKDSKSNYLILEAKVHLNCDIEEAIWRYLENQGWECFVCIRADSDARMSFKRLEDNE